MYLYNTQHSQETNIHATDGIRTRSLTKRLVTDLRLMRRGPQDLTFLFIRSFQLNNLCLKTFCIYLKVFLSTLLVPISFEIERAKCLVLRHHN